MRIVNAATAQTASVTLKNTSGVNVFTVEAISAGTIGNNIRVSVDYNTATPESTFNRLPRPSAGLTISIS
jgi:phage tail sheath gpL-like